jgi:hypothetical protein
MLELILNISLGMSSRDIIPREFPHFPSICDFLPECTEILLKCIKYPYHPPYLPSSIFAPGQTAKITISSAMAMAGERFVQSSISPIRS